MDRKEFYKKYVWQCDDSLCDAYGEIDWNDDTQPEEVWQWIEENFIAKSKLENELDREEAIYDLGKQRGIENLEQYGKEQRIDENKSFRKAIIDEAVLIDDEGKDALPDLDSAYEKGMDDVGRDLLKRVENRIKELKDE